MTETLSFETALTARSLDARLSDRSKFFEVGVEVRYLDFAYGIDGWFRLSVKALDRCSAKRGAYQH